MRRDSAARAGAGRLTTVLVVGLFALLLFGSTAAPGLVIEGDCGELVAAARTAGIPHAPGYPTYMLVAALVGRLSGPADLAGALALMSATFGAITVALVTLIGLRLSPRVAPGAPVWECHAAAALGGLLLAGALEFWNQSLGAEVYTMGTALLAACLYWTLFPGDRGRRLEAAALLAGLSFGVHYAIGPVCLVLVALSAIGRAGELGPRRLVGIALFLLLGLSTFLYLPIRSAADPLLDHGDPETPGGLLRVLITAERPTSAHSPGEGLARAAGLFPEFLRSLGSQWPAWVLLPIASGVVALARRSARRPGLLLGSVLVVVSLGSITAAGFEPAEEPVYEVRFLLLPDHVILALTAACGALFAGSLARRWAGAGGRTLLVLAWIAVGTLLVSWFASRYPVMDKSDDRVASDYGVALLAEAPPGAVVFTHGDNAWMALTYMQVVEDRSPDVSVVHVPLLERGWYRRVLERRFPALRLPGGDLDARRVAEANRGVAPLFSADPRWHEFPGHRLVPGGLLMRVVPEDSPVEAPPAIRPPHRFSPRHAARDRREETLLLFYPLAYLLVGDWYLERDAPARAAEAYRVGIDLEDPVPGYEEYAKVLSWLHFQLGRAHAAQGESALARRAWQRAAELAPASRPGRASLRRLQVGESGDR